MVSGWYQVSGMVSGCRLVFVMEQPSVNTAIGKLHDTSLLYKPRSELVEKFIWFVMRSFPLAQCRSAESALF